MNTVLEGVLLNGYTLYRIKPTKDKSQEVEVRKSVDHIWIYDRSGSMSGLIHDLCEDMIKQLDLVQPGDRFTLGWFSTEGKFDFLFIGLEVVPNKDGIIKTIRQNNYTIALTCFSNILAKTANEIAPRLSNLGGNISLMFFTDGYPVVNNTQKEIKAVMDALGTLQKQISSAVFVGYGDYYNKSLMRDMAQKAGGSLIHSGKLTDFSKTLSTFVKSGSSMTKRTEVDVPFKNPLMVVGIEGSGIVIYPFENGKVILPEGTKEFFVLEQAGSDPVPPTVVLDKEVFLHGVYACAYVAVASTNADVALDLLSEIGDVELIRRVSNAWTNAEYGVAEHLISKAALSPSGRFVSGKQPNYTARPDAFCLLDALEILADDNLAMFYPRMPQFKYKRTGVATKAVEGSLKFNANPLSGCRFGDLVWNSKRLNLSILAKIHGFVELPAEASDHGLPSTLRTFQWRNYTIVKDGILNVETLPVSMSKETFDILKNNSMIDSGYVWAGDDDIFEINLTSVPLVNRVTAEPPTGTSYCAMLDMELMLEYRQKFIKWWIAKFEDVVEPESKFSPEQFAYLEPLGFKADGSYSPKVVKDAAVDFYMATEFDVKIKGFSSAPKITDVDNKIEAGKSLTSSEALMSDQMELVRQMYGYETISDPVVLVRKLNEELSKTKQKLKEVRYDLQRTRFAVLLCKKWFNGLDTRDGAVVNLNDKQFTFSIREVQVEY